VKQKISTDNERRLRYAHVMSAAIDRCYQNKLLNYIIG